MAEGAGKAGMGTLENKVALVTGGARGIGAAIAVRLAQEGASVTITYPNNADGPDAVLTAIAKFGGRAKALEADNTDAEAVQAAVDEVSSAENRLDILVNNAGIITVKTIDEFTVEDFDRIFAINVRGAFVATRAAVPYMSAGGRIIMIGSSNADRMPFQGGSVYSLTKAAIAGFTKGLARDLGPRGITVNTVQPGPTATDLNPPSGPYAPRFLELMALDRFAQPSEVAGLVAYLASEEASFITGSSVTIDGGTNA